jgi:hypothetical protein
MNISIVKKQGLLIGTVFILCFLSSFKSNCSDNNDNMDIQPFGVLTY